MKKLIVVFLIASFPVDAQMEVKATQSTYLLKVRNQATFNDPLSIINEGNTITLIGYYNDYFTVLHSNDTGYVYYPYINNDIPGLSEFKSNHATTYRKWLSDQGFTSESERLAAVELNRLARKFGIENGRKLFAKRVWVGMSEEMLVYSKGQPDSKATASGHQNERWVYEGKNGFFGWYLYFDNGTVTAIERILPERLKMLIVKFGEGRGNAIYNKQVWIGMSAEMIRESIGEPESVNTTITKDNTDEQWVYPNRYLYFDNGILTAIQESK